MCGGMALPGTAAKDRDCFAALAMTQKRDAAGEGG
jgi:hypothetical protein